MSKVISKVLFAVVLLLVTLVSGCVSASNPTANQQGIDQKPSPGETESGQLSNIIGSILLNPDVYIDHQVEVIGLYRGYDLLKQIPAGPPVTRSDWVIADQTGTIYVTDMLPENLDPSSQADIDIMIRLIATVVRNQKGVFLKAQTIEVLQP